MKLNLLMTLCGVFVLSQGTFALDFYIAPNGNDATVTIVKRGPGIAYIDNTGVVPATYGLEEKCMNVNPARL